MLPTLLLVALYPMPLGLPFPEPLLLSPVEASSPHGVVWELHGVWDWHSFAPTVCYVEIPGSKWPPWPPCSSPPGPMPWLQCLFFLSLYLRLDTYWQDFDYYHRFLLKYTFFWHQRKPPPSVAFITTSRTCRCQARGTTCCFLGHSHWLIALLKSLKTCCQ